MTKMIIFIFLSAGDTKPDGFFSSLTRKWKTWWFFFLPHQEMKNLTIFFLLSAGDKKLDGFFSSLTGKWKTWPFFFFSHREMKNLTVFFLLSPGNEKLDCFFSSLTRKWETWWFFFSFTARNEKPDGSNIHFRVAANFQIPDFWVVDRMTAY